MDDKKIKESNQRLNAMQGMYEGLKASNESNKKRLAKLPSEDEIREMLVLVYAKSKFSLPCRGLYIEQARAISARLRGE